MSELRNGPFAEQLQQAIAKRGVSVTPTVSEPTNADLTASGDATLSPRSSDTGPEDEGQPGKTDAVSSTSVHRRLAAPENIVSTESELSQELEVLLADIDATARNLGTLEDFANAAGFHSGGDGELKDFAAKCVAQAKVIAWALRSERPSSEGASVEQLKDIQSDLQRAMLDVREALEDLEKTGEVSLPPKIKRLWNGSSHLGAQSLVGNGERQTQSDSSHPEASKKRFRNTGQSNPRARESEAGGDISEQFQQLQELVVRWQKCQNEFKPGKRRAWLEQQKGVSISAAVKAKEWLDMKDDPNTWREAKRRHFLEEILPPMQHLVDAAESAVQRPRERRVRQTAQRAAKGEKGDSQPSALAHPDKAEPSAEAATDSDGRTPAVVTASKKAQPVVIPDHPPAATNVFTFPSGRAVSGSAEMTPWEGMPAEQKNTLRRELFRLRDSFVRDLNARLEKIGASHLVRCKVIADSLCSYLEEAIPCIIKGVQLTPSDTEGLMSELTKELPIKA